MLKVNCKNCNILHDYKVILILYLFFRREDFPNIFIDDKEISWKVKHKLHFYLVKKNEKKLHF